MSYKMLSDFIGEYAFTDEEWRAIYIGWMSQAGEAFYDYQWKVVTIGGFSVMAPDTESLVGAISSASKTERDVHPYNMGAAMLLKAVSFAIGQLREKGEDTFGMDNLLDDLTEAFVRCVDTEMLCWYTGWAIDEGEEA